MGSKQRKDPLDFDDAGASDEEPVKGITQWHIRRWHDEAAALKQLLKKAAPYREWCRERDPTVCVTKGYCPRDPTCGD